MSTIREFTLPDPGEGLVEAEIVTWHVQAGDEVDVNQVVLEIETAKSLVELPIPWAGRVVDVLVREGETVEVGAPIVTVDVGGGADDGLAAPADSTSGEDDAPDADTADEESQKTLVGYGPVASNSQRRARRGRGLARVLAAPATRGLAKERGVDLAQVSSSRDDGVVTAADVENASSPARPPTPPSAETMASVMSSASSRDTADLTDERIPIKGVRKVTAQAMVASAFTAPHVTEFLTVDVTRTMDLVGQLQRDREFPGLKVTPLLVVAKACLVAMRREPMMNALWDSDAGEIVMRSQVNLGIAAATERGLLVPNVKDAGRLSLVELAREIGRLVETARSGKPSPAILNGGTFTISNIGVFGVDAGTPIIKPGESGILAIGAVRPTSWVVENPGGTQEIAIRQVAQLSLSFDHRIIDGDVSSRFLSTVGRLLENPAWALAWG